MEFLAANGMLDPAVNLTLRCALALLFVRALMGKLREPRQFANAIRDYELVPASSAGAIAAALLTIECALVPSLFIETTARLSALALAGLLLLYSAAIGINLLRGRRDIDCGCAGPAARQPLHEWLLYRNAGFIVLAIGAATPVAARQLIWIDALTIALAATCILALAVATDGLAALAARSRTLWSHP